jgi:hypothetical protein
LSVTSNGTRRQSAGKWAGWLAVAILAAGIIYLLVWYVPDAIARRNANPSVESAWIGAIAGFLGVVATAAVAITAFWYSRSTNQATIEAAKATTDKTINAAREAQFPDRYSTAVEQLGSDNLDVRIGGIYALEGIAAEYARHHPTVMELLAAFVREHSHEQWPPAGVPPLGSIKVGPGAVSSVLEQIEVPPAVHGLTFKRPSRSSGAEGLHMTDSPSTSLAQT